MVLRKSFSRAAVIFVFLVGMIFSAGAFCQQGQNANTGSSFTNNQGQPSAATGKSGSDANSFPAAQSEAAANAGTQQDQPSASQPNVPSNASSSSSQKRSSASQDNPFPEAQSKAAAKDDSASPQPSGGASTSAPGGYSSSDANLPPADLGQGDFRSHQKLDTFTRDQTQDGRIEDDLKVANLYMGNGNYRGALLRYQDAIQYDPQNDTALYGIAYAMCKENLTAEAMAHFKSYANNNPQGKYAIKAEKMLAHPNKCMHNF